ncbi:MAG: hypothetical protein U0325_34330 [Polyangiales bacterium]
MSWTPHAALLMLAVGCAHPPHTISPTRCASVEGVPTQSTARAGETDLHGMTLHLATVPSPPGTRVFEVRVSGPTVRRTLGGEAVCESRPTPTDPCGAITVDAFAHDLGLRLVDAGLRAEDISIDAVAVHRWSDLDGAVAAVADALRAGRIASAYRVELRPYTCVVAIQGGA